MRLRPFLIAVAAVIGAALTWWGATTLFASGVGADLEGTAGGLDLLPAAAAAGGIAVSYTHLTLPTNREV